MRLLEICNACLDILLGVTDVPASLGARSVVLSTLLGTDPPRMTVRNLLRVTQLFGLSPGTVRTALTRMVQRGELETDGDGTYRLAGALLGRQARQRQSQTADRLEWSGRWRLAVVTGDGRSAADRAELRQAMGALRFAEQREGVWLRPDNLPADRLPAARASADGQCTWFSAHPDVDDAELAVRLWDLDGWAATAHDLRRSVAELTTRVEAGETAALAEGFVVSAAVLRHFQADPLLPDELVGRTWPGARLRIDYDRYDRAYRRLLRDWLVGEDGGR
jgi:phenylacetic acid degradation operon negative regulatory protein